MKRGVTLIETLIAMVIFTTIILYSFSILEKSYLGLQKSNNQTTAMSFAETKLVYWQNQGYTWIVGAHLPSELSGTFNSGGTVFNWTVTPSTLVSGAAQVEVKIFYFPSSRTDLILWVNS